MSIQKTVWCLRHGLSLHNVMYKTMGMSAYTELEDTNLLEDGFIQAKNTNKNWKEINNIDIVYVSPLTRTIQTALNIFRGVDVKIYALDLIKEYPASYEKINKRKSKQILIDNYGDKIDFSLLLNEKDSYWQEGEENKESIYELKQRVDVAKHFLKHRNEKNIAMISHSSFINYFLYDNLDDENVELKHCFPYEYKL
tara:strand:+ start:600 stop:1190 length:591 start_codon:yes stop_codon:yes gene_type:complete